MDLELKDKVVLVTGVSRGIGLAVAEAFIAEGTQVVGTSRTAAAPIDGLTHVALDMRDPESGERAVAACIDRHGRLDILVNNVGSATLTTGFREETDDIWATYWELNFMSAVRSSRAALPHLIDSRGVIVNVSSVNGLLPETGIATYSTLKAAMNNLTVGLGREFAGQGVRVVGVAPGPVSTPLWLGDYGAAAQMSAMGGGTPEEIVSNAEQSIPIGRFAAPEEIASAVAFLASPRSGSTTATTLRIDGGLTPTL